MNRKVIIIGPAFPYRGGIANFNNSLAVEYKKQGADVKIYSFSLQYPSILFPGKTQYEKGNPPQDIDIEHIINSVNPFNWLNVARKINKINRKYFSLYLKKYKKENNPPKENRINKIIL